MITNQFILRTAAEIPNEINGEVALLLGFGNKALLEDSSIYNKLKKIYPNATIALSSSAGEIYGTTVTEDAVSIATISFEKTRMQSHAVTIGEFADSYSAGSALIGQFETDELQYVLVLADGRSVNGSELVKGMQKSIPDEIPITGGLAGDGADFNYTVVGLNEVPRQGRILAIGFYGSQLRVAHGSFGGWEPFGLEKVVTKSNANELFEINGRNALEIYKEYLGKYSAELPGSALLFPLSIQLKQGGEYLVRTILSIDKEKSSMVFAGDIPEGSTVRFMRANIDRLIDAASTAAQSALVTFDEIKPQIALLVSCVGRKLVLGGRVEEELDAVAEVLGQDVLLTGYYAYGEISPLNTGGSCELHNQTMTITCLQELL